MSLCVDPDLCSLYACLRSIPCAPVLNMILFAVPFADHGMTAQTLKIIHTGLQDEFEDKEIIVEKLNVV